MRVVPVLRLVGAKASLCGNYPMAEHGPADVHTCQTRLDEGMSCRNEERLQDLPIAEKKKSRRLLWVVSVVRSKACKAELLMAVAANLGLPLPQSRAWCIAGFGLLWRLIYRFCAYVLFIY